MKININVKEFNGKKINQKLCKLWVELGVPYNVALEIASLSDEDYRELLRGMMKWNEIIWKS